MNRERFEAIVAAYGADPARWPDDERAAALTTARDGDLDDARALDALLELAAPVTAPSDLLVAKILRAAREQTQSRPSARVYAPFAALAASMVFGVIAGYGLGLSAPPGEEVDAMIVAAFEAPDWFGEEG